MLALIVFDVDAAFRSGPVIEIADAQRLLFAVRRFAQITAPPALNVIEPELPVTTRCVLRYLTWMCFRSSGGSYHLTGVK